VQTPENYRNLWDAPNLLLQKFPAEEFTATAKIKLEPRFDGEKFGLVVMGLDYSYIGVTNKGGKLAVSRSTVNDADRGTPEAETAQLPLDGKDFYLRVQVSKDAVCDFRRDRIHKGRHSVQSPRGPLDRCQAGVLFYEERQVQ
jgi:beta-xylosidase